MNRKPNKNIERLTVAVVETLTPESATNVGPTEDELRAEFFQKNPNATEVHFQSVKSWLIRHAAASQS